MIYSTNNGQSWINTVAGFINSPVQTIADAYYHYTKLAAGHLADVYLAGNDALEQIESAIKDSQ